MNINKKETCKPIYNKRKEKEKMLYRYEYIPRRKRYTDAAVKAAEKVLLENNITVNYTGVANYEKIKNICDAANIAQNGFISFPIVCGIENIIYRRASM